MTDPSVTRFGDVTALRLLITSLLVTAALVRIPALLADSSQAAGATREVAPTTASINELLAEKWQANKLRPAERTTDDEFIRRASLDIIGRIATVPEVRAFEKDTWPDKRAGLIDGLLASKDYARHWADLWTVWLLGKPHHPLYQRELHAWLEGQFARNTSYKELVEKLLTATGTGSDNGAVDFILANLGMPLPKSDWAALGQFDMTPITARSSRLFLGCQLQCAECHCHPFNPAVQQKDFWQLNAFFRQIECQGQPLAPNAGGGDERRPELQDNSRWNAGGILLFEQRNGRQARATPIFLDGRKIGPTDQGTRRQILARFITSHDNFSRAYVNRMWGQFFGRGLNQQASVDDFGEHNEVIHPELLDRVAKDFARGGYDPKQLIRWICASDAYQLKSVSNPTNAPADAAIFFSRMGLKTLNRDQLFDSLLVAFQVEPDQAKRYRAKLREQWGKEGLLDVGFEEVADVDVQIVGSHRQALFLMNNAELADLLGRKDSGSVTRALAEETPARAADYLYLAALNRHPTAKEMAVIEEEIAQARKDDKGLTPLWQDLLWALCNSNEFIFNH